MEIHAIQFSTAAWKSPGVSYQLSDLSNKDWSAQAELTFEQVHIPEVLDNKTVHRYVKGLTMNYDDGFTSESCTELLGILAKDEVSKS